MKSRYLLLLALMLLSLCEGCATPPSIKEISAPELVLTDISFKEIRIGSIKFDAWLDIRNEGKVPLYIEYMKVDLLINDSPLGTGYSDKEIKIDKFKNKRVKLEYVLGMVSATSTVIQLIQNKDFRYTVKGSYSFKTREGHLDMPFEKKGRFIGAAAKEKQPADTEQKEKP